jgi:hypothetical protein
MTIIKASPPMAEAAAPLWTRGWHGIRGPTPPSSAEMEWEACKDQFHAAVRPY